MTHLKDLFFNFSFFFLSFFFSILSLHTACSEEATCCCHHLPFLKTLKQLSGYGNVKKTYTPDLQLAWRVCWRGHTLFLRRYLGLLDSSDLHIYEECNFYMLHSSTFFTQCVADHLTVLQIKRLENLSLTLKSLN